MKFHFMNFGDKLELHFNANLDRLCFFIPCPNCAQYLLFLLVKINIWIETDELQASKPWYFGRFFN